MLEIAIAAGFASWFGLSLAAQVLPRDSGIRDTRLGWLLPDCRFFAPEPAVEDRLIVFRCKSREQEIGPLELIELPRSGPLRWCWNPAARRHKALFDLADGVLRLAERLKAEGRTDFADSLVLSEPYLMSLNLVSSHRDAVPHGLVQFGVLSRAWPDRDELVFLSRWHTLGGEPVTDRAARIDTPPMLSREKPRRTKA